MKKKLLVFIVALLTISVFGIVQVQANAASQPGQVNNAPRCTATAIGERDKAYSVNNNLVATVRFKVTGADNCKVQLSSNSFYAPSMNGQPWSEQILFQRVTRTYTPGTYAMSIQLPTKSNPDKGCYYQVDLTYGTHNILPVLAYGHGEIPGCIKKPAASCQALTVTPQGPTTFRFAAQATTVDGAKITGYVFTVARNGQVVDTKQITTSQLSAVYTYTQATPGTYGIRVIVKTSVGDKTGPDCAKSFTVTPPAPNNLQVCELATKKIITIKESEFDASKHSKNLADCKEEMCPIPGKEHLPKNSPDCKENCPIPGKEQLPKDSVECVETPVTPPITPPSAPEQPNELPTTGPAETALSILGLGSMIASVGVYFNSRRTLLDL
jgi:hypothetical protein